MFKGPRIKKSLIFPPLFFIYLVSYLLWCRSYIIRFRQLQSCWNRYADDSSRKRKLDRSENKVRISSEHIRFRRHVERWREFQFLRWTPNLQKKKKKKKITKKEKKKKTKKKNPEVKNSAGNAWTSGFYDIYKMSFVRILRFFMRNKFTRSLLKWAQNDVIWNNNETYSPRGLTATSIYRVPSACGWSQLSSTSYPM